MQSQNKYRNKVREAELQKVEEELAKLRAERNKPLEEVTPTEPKEPVVEPEPKVEPKKEDENWKQRYADLQRHLQQVKDSYEEKLREEQAKPKTDTPDALSDADFEEWVKKYPVVVKAINRVAEKVAEDKVKNFKDQMQYLEDLQRSTARNQALQLLIDKHPDFLELSKTKEFTTWLEQQDQEDIDAIRNPKSFDENAVNKAARVVKFFKLETNYKSNKSKPKGEPADLVTKTRATSPEELDTEPKFTESMIEEMSARDKTWFARNREAIMTARRKGPPYFIYDVSGAGG